MNLSVSITDKAYSFKTRKGYTNKVLDILRRQDPETLLEIGTGGISLSPESMIMDRVADFGADIVQDAGSVPWPFKDGSFDGVVALQVWEHLGGNQEAAFNEAWRVADKFIILSLPYKWTVDTECHQGIDDDVVLGWSGGVCWCERYLVKDMSERAIYLWKK